MTRRALSLSRLGGTFAALAAFAAASAQPAMTVPQLSVRTASSGFFTPIALAFIGPDDYLVLEKNTGRVVRVTNGIVAGPVLDLPVNFASERGLLGIAVHPGFATNGWIYLFWSESLSGADSGDLLDVPLLGNRVDRFVWNGSSLTMDLNLLRLRSFQNDATNPAPRGNHDGGVLSFGPDGKLYAIFGDVGRRGWLQNNLMGPVPDDPFGGPEPDDAHFSGVILRLNDDGTAPEDNPFFGVGAAMGGEAGQNLRRTYAYGVRNSFGMAFDPYSGSLWFQDNAEDAFDELNVAAPGMNAGWIQIMGPVSRVAEYRQIETTSLNNDTPVPNLQQFRWPPENIAKSAAEALSRLYMLPGAEYRDPVLSWRYVVAPAAIGFVKGRGLGSSFEGDLLMGLSTLNSFGGPLLRFNLAGNRRKIAADSPDLGDGVVDNATFYDLGSTADNVIGVNFGIVTDIENSPGGSVYAVSLTQGSVYEIRSAKERKPKGKPST
ncbi:MAG TPA: PQQ-dependent sugar dehydrogenase [Fimbriimonas sp.]